MLIKKRKNNHDKKIKILILEYKIIKVIFSIYHFLLINQK